MNTVPSKPAVPAVRSPAYPNISLREAIENIAKIEKLYRSAPVAREDAAKLIGYKVLSGPANKALAALANYGLFDRAGKGEARVTELARSILHAADENERRMRLRDAAFAPDLFRELRERFAGVASPPEDGIITFLNRQGFNANAVRPAAKAFLETLRFIEEQGVSDSNEERLPNTQPPISAEGSGRVFGGAVVGDLVQWESAGTLQLSQPRKVRAISDDGKWVFVEHSETGIPMSEIVVEEKAVAVKPPQSPPTLPLEAAPPKGMRKEVFALEEGDVVVTFPDNLSPESFADLDAYLKVFIAKMRRRAGTTDSA